MNENFWRYNLGCREEEFFVKGEINNIEIITYRNNSPFVRMLKDEYGYHGSFMKYGCGAGYGITASYKNSDGNGYGLGYEDE